MPYYNINLRTASHIADMTEVNTESVEELRVEVARFISELLREHATALWIDQDWQVDVTDDKGMILFVVHLSAYASPAASKGKAGGL
jgi:hypothetical protein